MATNLVTSSFLAAAQSGALAQLQRDCYAPLLKGVIPGCIYGETALHHAAYNGHEHCVLWLLQQGADPKFKGSISGSTPLHSAASGGHTGICAILIAMGSPVNELTVPVAGWTPADCANNSKHLNTLWFLMQQHGVLSQTKPPVNQNPFPALARQPAGPDPNKLLVNGNLHIQIASDLHIEFYGDIPLPDDMIIPSAPIVALLGDIGIPYLPNYERFLLQQAQRFELVLVIAGNHEYYNTPTNVCPFAASHAGSNQENYTISQIKNLMKTICAKHPKLLYCDQATINIQEYCILATTLWSFIPVSERDRLQRSMNDYIVICGDNLSPLTPHGSTEMFQTEAKWLTQAVLAATAAKQTCVVLTHHTPSYSIPGGGVGWSNNLDHLFKDQGTSVAAWAFGHTHHNVDLWLAGTRCVSNQRGYLGNETEEYKASMYIIVRKN